MTRDCHFFPRVERMTRPLLAGGPWYAHPDPFSPFGNVSASLGSPRNAANQPAIKIWLYFRLSCFHFSMMSRTTTRSSVCGRVLSPQSGVLNFESWVLTQCMVKSGERQRSSIEPLGVVFPAPPFVLLSLFSVRLACPFPLPSPFPLPRPLLLADPHFEIRTATLAYSLHYISRCH